MIKTLILLSVIRDTKRTTGAFFFVADMNMPFVQYMSSDSRDSLHSVTASVVQCGDFPLLLVRFICKFIYGLPGSSVGIATDYELDGPGSNPGGDEIFRPPRPALGPTQPPVKWVPVLSRG